MKTKFGIAILFLALSACANDSSYTSSTGSPASPNNGGDVSEGPGLQAARDKCSETPRNPGTDIRYVMSSSTNGQSCTTGCQIFTSRYSYCSGILNDSLNNNCARSAREENYDRDCR